MTANKRPVLVAPDKFKGTFTAAEVARAVADGLARVGIAADFCGIADGGEGTLDRVVESLGGEVHSASCHDAIGLPRDGRFAVVGEGRGAFALVESADAIGLELIPEHKRDALAASSRGVGELIAAAAGTGVREIYVAVGGTASTDGGAGALEALCEAKLVGRRGALKGLPKLTALCDVRAAWEQAALVFSSQKGASRVETAELASRLDALAAELPRDPRGKLLTGAGGGLSGGLWAACGAELKSGAAFVLDAAGFTPRMLTARAVITGEGALDRQTLLGKAVGEVATRARQAGVPCHAIVGEMRMSEFDARILDFESWTAASTLDEISDAAERLVGVVAQR